MGNSQKRKCLSCRKLYKPDYRNRNRQRYCKKPECKKACKVASQRKWLNKPENRDCFKGKENVIRVQEWRRNHPGYWRRGRRRVFRRTPLQDACDPQVTYNKEDMTNALQDRCFSQPALLVGVISILTGSALQDDIDKFIEKAVNQGTNILEKATRNTVSPRRPK